MVFLLSTLVMLTACTIKKDTIKDSEKEIDKKLVYHLVGSWVADSYDYGDYELTYDEKKLTFNSTKLEIEYTKDNKVFTHQENDKTFHYIFEVNEEEIIVYPSYKVEQSSDELMVGGDLAPIKLKKETT